MSEFKIVMFMELSVITSEEKEMHYGGKNKKGSKQ